MTQRPADITDRAYIEQLTQQYCFQFYITAGPSRGVNQVHWGPPERLSIPQGALSVNMGPATNVESLNFRFDGLRPQRVTYESDDRTDTLERPSASRGIPLSADFPKARRSMYLVDDDETRAKIRAQSAVDQSFDEIVTANGELDALRYNKLLRPRALVGLRGAGRTYDGLYYVKSVTHNVSKGRYTQSFSLAREGTGTTTPFVMP
jgi:hypothetical protein